MGYDQKNLDDEYMNNVRERRLQYVLNNAKFKVGDFIRNVTGIIKVDRIDYDMMRGEPQIIYYGKRYKKLHGKLLRTKDKKESSLRENSTRKIKFGIIK